MVLTPDSNLETAQREVQKQKEKIAELQKEHSLVKTKLEGQLKLSNVNLDLLQKKHDKISG